MKCIYCDEGATKVVDTREDCERIRRRRECKECGRRFTTYETAEKLDIKVIKRDGTEQKFDEEKIRKGVERAANKTPLTDEQVEEIVENVKNEVRGSREVHAEDIGEKVKEELRKRNEVAYIRFASVYDSFENAESFKKEVQSLQNE
ncbi:MAG: transcriptional regulator NrdR [Candidatus Nanohaloarchaea archaeon]